MSIAVDLGLFLRNSKTKLGLTLTHRGVLFTLAIRVGNNSSTWISQETLAIELGVTERNARQSMSKIKSTKIVLIEQQKIDKRKNLYSFNPILANYHQLIETEKALIHKKLGDVYQPIEQSKSHNKKPNYRSKSSSNNLDTGRNHPVVEVIETSETVDTSTIAGAVKSPKEKAYNNIYNQTNRAKQSSANLTTYQEDFFPDEKSRLLLTKHAQRTNMTEHSLLTKFEKVSKEYKTRSKDWQETFVKFLESERPKKTYEDEKGRKRRYDNQSMYD